MNVCQESAFSIFRAKFCLEDRNSRLRGVIS